MSQDEKGGMGILQILLIIAILIGLLPVFFWMVALQKFGTEANYTEAHTSFALIFCTVVQLVLWVIFWATSESWFLFFFQSILLLLPPPYCVDWLWGTIPCLSIRSPRVPRIQAKKGNRQCPKPVSTTVSHAVVTPSTNVGSAGGAGATVLG